MVALAVGKTIRTMNPTLLVDGGLPAGNYRFRLVVLDNELNASLPSDLIVQITAAGTIRPGIRTPPVSVPTEILMRRPRGGTR